GVAVAVGVPLGVGLGVSVAVALGVLLGVAVGVAVAVGVSVAVGLGVGVFVGVGVAVGLGVGVGGGASTVSVLELVGPSSSLKPLPLSAPFVPASAALAVPFPPTVHEVCFEPRPPLPTVTVPVPGLAVTTPAPLGHVVDNPLALATVTPPGSVSRNDHVLAPP